MPQRLCEWFEKSKEGVTREEYEEEEGRQVPTSSVRRMIRGRFMFLKINGHSMERNQSLHSSKKDFLHLRLQIKWNGNHQSAECPSRIEKLEI